MQLKLNYFSPRFVVRCLTLSLAVSFVVFTFSTNFSNLNHCNKMAFEKELLSNEYKKLQQKYTDSRNLIKKLEMELDRKSEMLKR